MAFYLVITFEEFGSQTYNRLTRMAQDVQLALSLVVLEVEFFVLNYTNKASPPKAPCFLGCFFLQIACFSQITSYEWRSWWTVGKTASNIITFAVKQAVTMSRIRLILFPFAPGNTKMAPFLNLELFKKLLWVNDPWNKFTTWVAHDTTSLTCHTFT